MRKQRSPTVRAPCRATAAQVTCHTAARWRVHARDGRRGGGTRGTGGEAVAHEGATLSEESRRWTGAAVNTDAEGRNKFV